MTTFTIDTFAWIEYLEGTVSGEKIGEIIENDNEYTLFTPSIVLAELADALARGKLKINWEDIVRFIKFNTKIIEINEDIARDAGLIKFRLRKKYDDFGLVDGVVLATSLYTSSKLLTGDPHLVGENNVIDIRKI